MDEISLVEIINEEFRNSHSKKLSLGKTVKAMILNCLRYSKLSFIVNFLRENAVEYWSEGRSRSTTIN
jgi:hypothetical protein